MLVPGHRPPLTIPRSPSRPSGGGSNCFTITISIGAKTDYRCCVRSTSGHVDRSHPSPLKTHHNYLPATRLSEAINLSHCASHLTTWVGYLPTYLYLGCFTWRANFSGVASELNPSHLPTSSEQGWWYVQGFRSDWALGTNSVHQAEHDSNSTLIWLQKYTD